MVNKLLDLLNKTHSQYHYVANAKQLLLEAGFEELNEANKWKITANSKFFVTRSDSSLIAFKIPKSLQNPYFHMIASHSDSPTFKLKSAPDTGDGHYSKLSVEGYGGMINSTFLDRPLSIAGRVVVESEGKLETRLVDIDKDLLVIPNVAIHQNRDVNDGFKYNHAVDMLPLAAVNKGSNYFEDLLKKYVLKDEERVLGHDLYLYNRQKAGFLGENDELIGSPKLDNLECAYLTLLGLIDSEDNNAIDVYACFDNEEIGSESTNGADSTFLIDVLTRIGFALGLNDKEDLQIAAAKSFVLSADNAHAIHPNHPELYDSNVKSYMNGGVVIKYNSNMSYCTTGVSAAYVKQLCESVGVPYQEFANKSGSRGGGTLGKISLSHFSANTADIGLAQLAMHSSYEVAGTKDVECLYKLAKVFFEK
ncbi:MAG: M18 family aminopeptidase [Bacilli bacterium]|nr:M18 family aminopeptidase [Bacilli bacterium]